MGTDENKNEFPEKDLTEKIIGIAFQTQNEVGIGYSEKIYQNAYEHYLKKSGLDYKRESYCKLVVDGKIIGSYRLDFLVEDKIVVELKTRDTIYDKDVHQILNYLKFKRIKVGLLLYFGNFKVKIKRVVL